MRDDLLPEIFRAFAIFNGFLLDSTDIHITVGTLRVALRCIRPDMAEVRYLLDRLEFEGPCERTKAETSHWFERNDGSRPRCIGGSVLMRFSLSDARSVCSL